MSTAFMMTFSVRWADVDPNGHLRNSAYSDYATHVRFSFFEESGFGPIKIRALGVGPVVFREETRYLKEVRMSDQIAVDLRAKEIGDGGRWTLIHRVWRGDTVAAVITLEGAWLDLKERRVCPAPAVLSEILAKLPRAESADG